MNNTHEHLHQDRANYQSLPALHKAVIQILAVHVDFCPINIILNGLSNLGFLHNNKKFTPQSWQPIKDDLTSLKLVNQSKESKKNKEMLACHDSIRTIALLDALRDGRFPTILETFYKDLRMVNIPGIDVNNARQMLRMFQIVLFSCNDTEEWLEFDQYLFDYADEDDFDLNPYILTLNNPFLPALMEQIDPEIRSLVTLNLFDEITQSLDSVEEIATYLLQNSPPTKTNYSTAPTLAFHQLLCGNTAEALTLMEPMKDSEHAGLFHSYHAWVAALCGNYQEAGTMLDQVFTEYKKRTRKRKVLLPGYSGIFHLLTLLAAGDQPALQQGLTLIDTGLKGNHDNAYLLTILRAVFEAQQGKASSQTYVPHYTMGVTDFRTVPIEYFFSNLFFSWCHPKAVQENASSIAAVRDRALHGGYFWLAAEFASLLAAVGVEQEYNSSIAEPLHIQCGTVSLVNLLQKKQAWEKILHGLLDLTQPDTTAPKAAQQDQRLVWLINPKDKYGNIKIAPRLQLLSKKGGWTKGRAVAMKNLSENHMTMDWLTEQDHRVCGAIESVYEQTYYNFGFGSTSYELNPVKALPALVDHPLLFLHSAPAVQLELVAGEPEIQLTHEKGKLRLSVSPEPTNAEVALVKETATRFRVVRFSRQHREIMEWIGNGLTIPKAGEKLAGQVMDSLSSLITVHSDLSTGKTVEGKIVETDSTPYAHIIPYQDGISLEFQVKPCGSDGPAFRPGQGGKNVLTTINDEKIRTTRNFSQEKQLRDEVIHACPTLAHLEVLDGQRQVDNAEESLELLLELKECGEQVRLEWPQGESFKVRKRLFPQNLALQIKQERDWFKATGSLAIDDDLSLDLRKLLELLQRATGRFIPLDDGTFLTLTAQLQKRLEDLACFGQEHGKGVRFTPLASPALDDLTEELGQFTCDTAWKNHCKRLSETVTPAVPSTLQGSLRDYQRDGFTWLARLAHWGAGGCLADDMGLGKTIQALAAILLRASQGPTLVVAPLSVTTNWVEEAARFAPTLNVIVFGPGDREQVINELQPFDLLIVSYGLLPLEAERLCRVAWQTVVLDEAQAIKNMQTKRSRAAMELQAQFRIITTGTPIENHLGELWTLFHFLNPGLLGSLKRFNENFAVPIEREQDSAARWRLRRLIRPYILRRLKSDVLQELPAKTEITLEVEMSEEEEKLYEALRLQALDNIEAHSEDGPGQQHLRILAEITRLRRFCCNPELILPESEVNGSKLKVFGDTVRELLANNHKVLVFSQFVDHLAILRSHLEKEEISYQYLDGSTSVKERKRRIAEFQNGQGDVFLISLKAGGSGLNLTAADYVIHMDPWWNPAVEDQASDRAHRIGQERPVTVYRLVMKHSIEEQIVDLHKQKRDLADSLLEGTDTAGKVSAEELLGLLRGEGE